MFLHQYLDLLDGQLFDFLRIVNAVLSLYFFTFHHYLVHSLKQILLFFRIRSLIGF